MKDALEDLCRGATKRAEDELVRLGFRQSEEADIWLGEISDGDLLRARVRLKLPPTFPVKIPVIALEGAAKDYPQAHVERNGALCVASSSGLLVDVTRPEAIVQQVLARAGTILFEQELDAEERDLAVEFLSYWPDDRVSPFESICPVSFESGQIAIFRLRKNETPTFFAPDEDSAYAWSAKVGRRTEFFGPAYFLRLLSLFRVPRFEEKLTLRGLLSILRRHISNEDFTAFETWLAWNGLPANVLCSAPIGTDDDRTLFAVGLRELSKQMLNFVQKGFRPGRIPQALVIKRMSSEPIVRLDVDRLDPEYLLARGGGRRELLTKSVVLVGCGAIGSQLAAALCAAGVGKLRLVDPELLAHENVQRHLLGVSHVGSFKVDALKEELGRRFPHVSVDTRREEILKLIGESPEATTDADLVALALGEETIERTLSRILPAGLRRVHVWLEPFGLGGHVLRTDEHVGPGCFECLYRGDDEFGIVSMASLCAPGQSFRKTLGACAGTFTPYGMGDAMRAALEAARCATDILLGEERGPVLRSWISSKNEFARQGFRLSRRGESIAEGNIISVADFSRADCEGCRRIVR